MKKEIWKTIKKKNEKLKKAFTLVEVLLCVGIIGIIAAITIPTLLASTSEKALAAQKQALHSRMSQAFAQIKNLKSYEVNGTLGFLTEGLSTVYKLSGICTATDLRSCGVPDSIAEYYSDDYKQDYSLITKTSFTTLNTAFSATDWGNLDLDAAAFKTANGESILVYYNPRCKSKKETEHSLVESICVNMIYDLNGRNGAPNVLGEDIGFITVFYPTDPNVVMPDIYNKKLFEAGSFKNMQDKAIELGLLTPTNEEAASVLLNKELIHILETDSSSDYYWSGSYANTGKDGEQKAWTVGLGGVKREDLEQTHKYFLLKKKS